MIFGLLGCFLGCDHATAADYYGQSWQTDEGLPGNAVNDVLQDQKGYIWLATIDGLVRFDGMTFKQFSSPLIERVAARNIRALAQTSDGTILMLPAVGGVVQFKNGQFSQHPVGGDFAGKQFQTLFVDQGGAVWLGSAGGMVRHWLAGVVTNFGPANGLSSRVKASFAADNAGGVWIASGGFLGCYRDGQLRHFSETLNPTESTVVASSRSGGIWVCKNRELLKMDDGQLSTVSTNLPWVALGGDVREMFEDSNRVLWIGTGAQGLFRFDGSNFYRVETSQSQITHITEDDEGDIWVATSGGGINRLRPKLFQLYNTKTGLPEDVSDALCADKRGDVWLANRSSGPIRISDGKVFIPKLPGPHNYRAYTLCADDQGFLWGSEGGLYRFPCDNPDKIQSVSNSITGNIIGVHVLFKSRNGDIWVGADLNLLGCFSGGLLENYIAEKSFPGQRARSIAEDSAGRIWIGTEEGRLYQFADGKFITFTEQNGLPNAPIRSLCADADGSLWIGTIGGGLVLWRNGKFTIISIADGLPDDNIAEMAEDDAGRLWCGTRGGIFHVGRSELLAFADGKIPKVTGITFGRSEGLAEISCLGSCQPMTCNTPDGRLWFATQQGALTLDAAALKSNSRPPPVFIDGLFVNDRPLEIADPLRVPPLCNKIEFRFSVLSYAAPEKVHIRYKLDDVDSDWVEIVNQRAAVYSALRPGKYRLQLKACNDDGVWNEIGTSLSFVVLPTWWQSWWFKGSVLVFLVTISVVTIRYLAQRRLKFNLERLEHQQSLAKERTRIARDLHDDLGATVTQVGLMLEELRTTPSIADGIKAQSAAISGRVLNLARDLDAVVWSVNPSNDSLGELFAYLSQSFLECFRRTTIRPRLEVMEAGLDSALAPDVRHHLFLVVKEAMNNVIKHSQATEAILSLKVVENVLEIGIADNGRGFSPDAIARSKRQGLPNMRARIEQLGGKFIITSKLEQGTSLRILIPSWKDLRAGQHHIN